MSKDTDGSPAAAKLATGTASGMGQVVPFVRRDRPVAVGVQSGTVVPLRMFDRWDSAVAGIGGHPGVTDRQLRDVFLLMVAEMSGMVASKGRSGNQ